MSYIPILSSENISANIDQELIQSLETLSINNKSIQALQKQVDSVMTTPPTLPTFDIRLLQIVPEFDGNPCRLYRYISTSSDLLNDYWNTAIPNCVQNKLLLNGIFSKLTGPAEEIFSLSGSNDWNTIKNLLITHFGDQRNESSLLSDLGSLRQQHNENSLQFYARIVSTLNLLHNYINLHETLAEVKTSKKSLYDSHALHTLLVGLREPQSSMVRSMKPKDLAEAQKYIIEDNNIRYLQKSMNTNVPKLQIQKTHMEPPIIQNQSFNRFQFSPNIPKQPQFVQPNFNKPQFPRGPIQIQPRTNLPPQRFPTNSQVFGKPSNVWKPSHNAQPRPRPTPMSTVTTQNFTRNSNYPQQNRNYFQRNSNGNRNFTFEELTNVEHEQTDEIYDFNVPTDQDYEENNTLDPQEEYTYEYDHDTTVTNFQEIQPNTNIR